MAILGQNLLFQVASGFSFLEILTLPGIQSVIAFCIGVSLKFPGALIYIYFAVLPFVHCLRFCKSLFQDGFVHVAFRPQFFGLPLF